MPITTINYIYIVADKEAVYIIEFILLNIYTL